jgi:excreted virulence factor EspC (type VII ESX diderm)
MGQKDAFVDATVVRTVASRLDATAVLIEGAARTHFGRLVFDGATAGRAHVGHGDALRVALHRLVSELDQWERATVEIATSLRVSADHYAEADLRAAARVG